MAHRVMTVREKAEGRRRKVKGEVKRKQIPGKMIKTPWDEKRETDYFSK